MGGKNLFVCVCVCFFFFFFSGHSWGRKAHEQNPQNNTGQSCEKLLMCFFVCLSFFAPNVAENAQETVDLAESLFFVSNIAMPAAIYRVPRGPGRKVPHGVLFECFLAVFNPKSAKKH